MLTILLAATVATLPSNDLTDPAVALPLYRECALATASEFISLDVNPESIATAADAECVLYLNKMRRPVHPELASASQAGVVGYRDQVRGEIISQVLRARLKARKNR